jgi:hypothetical protein
MTVSIGPGWSIGPGVSLGDPSGAPPGEAPTITGISTYFVAAIGGTPISIFGTNFSTATLVTIDGESVAFTITSDAQIDVASTPVHAAGSADVIVTNPSGASSAVAIEYVGAPTVTGISPNTGYDSGNELVTITGTNFTLPNGSTPIVDSVSIGGTAATLLSVIDANTLEASTGAHSIEANVSVDVTTVFGTNEPNTLFSYIAVPPGAPYIDSFSPRTGSPLGGTLVTIIGGEFIDVTSVTFDSVEAASFTVVDQNTIEATTPAGTAGMSLIMDVTTDYGQIGVMGWNYTDYNWSVDVDFDSATLFTYNVISVDLVGYSGSIETLLEIPVGAELWIIDQIYTTTSLFQLQSYPPQGTVYTAGVSGNFIGANQDLLTINWNQTAAPSAAPTISTPGLFPDTTSVDGGNSMEIYGTNFATATQVTIDSVSVTFIILSDATIYVESVPAHAAGSVNVIVTNPSGASNAATLDYV